MIVLIGNSPSSGSTLLADLMDALPKFACGPESRFFCYKQLYENYDTAKRKIGKRFAFNTPSIQNYRGTFSYKARVLNSYGQTKESINQLASQSETFPAFISKLQEQYLSSRTGLGKTIWVEKYPENVLAAQSFLNTFHDGFFIHIVRDPLYVYNSLRKNRGFPPDVAMATWLLCVAEGYQLRNHPNCIEVEYSDLVENPFETIAKIEKTLTGTQTNLEELQTRYEENTYRKNSEYRNSTWNVSEYGQIQNANQTSISQKIADEYNSFSNFRISKEYAAMYGLSEIRMKELCEHYGYKAPTGNGKRRNDLASKRHLFIKFVLDYLYGDCSLKDLKPYLTPIDWRENSTDHI